MLIELVDALRCPAPHADAHLVASVTERRGRRVWAGALGCPVCRASYAIVGGVAHFGVAPAEPVDAMMPHADDAEADRAAALLDLAEPGGLVLLAHEWTPLAAALEARCHAHYVLLDAPPVDAEAEVSPLRVRGPLPFAGGVFRAVAGDGVLVTGDAAARLAAPRGRVVLPAAAPLPPELKRLASDARHVVAEREVPASAPVPLRRRAPFTG